MEKHPVSAVWSLWLQLWLVATAVFVSGVSLFHIWYWSKWSFSVIKKNINSTLNYFNLQYLLHISAVTVLLYFIS